MRPKSNSLAVIAYTMFGGEMALHITLKTYKLKFGGVRFLVWGSFSASGTGRLIYRLILHIIEGRMAASQMQTRTLPEKHWQQSTSCTGPQMQFQPIH